MSVLFDAIDTVSILLFGPSNLITDTFEYINIPFIVGCLFVIVLIYDICRMLGVLIHG